MGSTDSTSLTLATCHFKEVNDRFGHPAGDEALRSVGALMATTKRRTDTVARIGGEEFALLLPNADRAGARESAEHVRRVVEDFFGEQARRDAQRRSRRLPRQCA